MDAIARLKALLLATIAALALATGAGAEIITASDTQGRPITFDVRASDVDVEWYAALLRGAAHGDEISDVTIRILPESQVPAFCGAAAEACYSQAGGGLMVVPAGKDIRVANTFLHEYGHHVDHTWAVTGVRELNGTPVWWQLRGMAERLQASQVAFDYSRGWNRSIGEIFAEDYAWVHLRYQYAIPWLTPPDEALRTALLAELGGQPQPLPATPAAGPLLLTRSGTLAPRRAEAIPFGLLGPGRRVTFTATVGRSRRAGVRARVEVNCNGRRVATQSFARGRATRTIDVPNLGPGSCQARVVSTTGVPLTYSLRLQLAIQA